MFITSTISLTFKYTGYLPKIISVKISNWSKKFIMFLYPQYKPTYLSKERFSVKREGLFYFVLVLNRRSKTFLIMYVFFRFAAEYQCHGSSMVCIDEIPKRWDIFLPRLEFKNAPAKREWLTLTRLYHRCQILNPYTYIMNQIRILYYYEMEL